MKKTGTLNTGVQETTKNKLDVRADNKTVLQADSSGLTGHVSNTESGIFRNPKTINSTVTISSDENAVMAGPIIVGANGSLVVEGTLVIV